MILHEIEYYTRFKDWSQDFRILIDTDDKLPDDVKNAVILMTCFIKDHTKFYS